MVAALLLSALVLAGCGGGDDDGATTAPTTDVTVSERPTKAEFIKQADAICKRGSDEISAGSKAFKAKLGMKPDGSLSKAQQEELITAVVVPSVKRQAEGVARLKPPPDDLDEANQLAAGLGRVAGSGEEDPATILTTAGAVGVINEAAKEYGVLECTQP